MTQRKLATQRQDEDTKTELARAARELLLAQGLVGFSMRKVASICDISATAIYRHYQDKDELVAQAVLESFRIFGSYLMDALEERTPIRRFRALGRRYVDFALQNPADYRIIFMTDCQELGMKHLDEISRREISGTFQLLQDRISECQRAGIFEKGDPRTLAASVWASTHGLSSLLVTGNLSNDPNEVEHLIKLHLNHLERGLKA